MCWLTLIDIAEVEVIVRPNGNVDLFLRVSVEVSKIERVRPVRIGFPAVECGTDILAARIWNLTRDRKRGHKKAQKAQAGYQFVIYVSLCDQFFLLSVAPASALCALRSPF